MKRTAVILVPLVALLLGGGSWLLTRDPGPDFAGQDRRAIARFIASDAFNDLPADSRQRIANDYLDRLTQTPFDELMAMAFGEDAGTAAFVANIRAMPQDQRDQVWDRVARIGVDAFWREPAGRRRVYLTGFALAQQYQIEQNPEAFPLPSAAEFRADVGRLMARQDPKTQALGGRFLLDLRQTRARLGLKDPF